MPGWIQRKAIPPLHSVMETYMRSLRHIIAVASLGSFLAACADSTGPVSTGDRIGPVPTAGISVAYASMGNGTTPTARRGSLARLRFLPGAPRLRRTT